MAGKLVMGVGELILLLIIKLIIEKNNSSNFMSMTTMRKLLESRTYNLRMPVGLFAGSSLSSGSLFIGP